MNEAPQIRDIAPPVDVFPYPLWLVVTVAVAAALLIALIAWLVFQRLSKKPAAPPPTPYEIALAALRRAREQLDTLDPHAFGILVSDILRDYLLQKFGLPATRQTSDEFLRTLEGYAKFSTDEKMLLARFLEKCDLIKFARVDASRSDSEALLDQAVRFVNESANMDSRTSTVVTAT